MKILYFDVTNGVSGDMVLKALMELGNCEEQVLSAIGAEALTEKEHTHGGGHGHAHHHNHHSHGRSYQDVKALIENSSFSQKAKETAHAIYGYIADAEAKVHGETLETVHFHEVGRDEAIKNALGIGMALEQLAPERIYTSYICDGKGTVLCSHGEIPVPVPAVMALREKCPYVFQQVDINMEMVTPSGLASLMGIGAMPADTEKHKLPVPPDKMLEILLKKARGIVMSRVEAKGSRNTGRPGLKVYLVETASEEGVN